MKDIKVLLGANVRDYRKAKGLSQGQLVELCRLHFFTLVG